MREGQRRATVTKGATYRQAITFLADGTCLIASRDDVLERFAVDDLARPLASWKVPEAFVLLPSPDGTKVAAGPLEATRDVQPVRVLHLETSKVTTLPGRLKALAWTRGSHGLLCSDGTALVVQRA
jgi:hypothetical protein